MGKLLAIVLAAGKGTRMKSRFPKVIHKVCGNPMAEWVRRAAVSSGADDVLFVIGSGADAVKTELGNECDYVVQEEQLGTGHAVKICEDKFKGYENILILSGDTPLITAEMLTAAYERHIERGNSATVVSAVAENPYGYGRIIKKGSQLAGIVEEKDASAGEQQINEINSGIYFFRVEDLAGVIGKVDNKNAQGEYYLTDTIHLLLEDGKQLGTYIANHEEILGVNDLVQLHKSQKIMNQRITEMHMRNGVTFIDADSTYIGADVSIGADTIIHPQTSLEGSTIIGENVVIRQSRVVDSEIGDDCEINNSVILESTVGINVKMGPFAFVRPNSHIGNNIKIGDFVEIKNSTIGNGSKVPHLSYIGDADVGSGVNIGCGTIAVNYDGQVKHRTHINDHVFVGCNANLVAPVELGEGCFIAAGSTITKNVPENSLGIARAHQVNKENWRRKSNK